jgi:hypothetical protein
MSSLELGSLDLFCEESLDPEDGCAEEGEEGEEAERTMAFRSEWHTWLYKLFNHGHVTLPVMFRTAYLADKAIVGNFASEHKETLQCLFPACLGIARKFEGRCSEENTEHYSEENTEHFTFRKELLLINKFTKHGMLLESNLRRTELSVLKSLEFRVSGPTVLCCFLDTIAELGVDIMTFKYNLAAFARFLLVTREIMLSKEVLDDDSRRTVAKRGATRYVSFLQSMNKKK